MEYEMMVVVDGVDIYAEVIDEGEYQWYRSVDMGWELEVERDPEFAGFYYLDEEGNPVDATDNQVVEANQQMRKDYWLEVVEGTREV